MSGPVVDPLDAGDGLQRTIVVWCPDRPVAAATAAAGLEAGTPVALLEHGVVHACSAAARRAGVKRGLRMREAQSRCASLVVLPYDPALDARAFEPVLAALEAGVPSVAVVRPGLVVLRASGPARYYGGERAAAEAIWAIVADAGVDDVRVGVADGPFPAEQAARATSPGEPVRIVEAGAAGAFLAPLPVSVLGRPELAALLVRLGIPTLGAFAALREPDVRARFGEPGVLAHRVAAGRDPRRAVPRAVPAERAAAIDFEPPMERMDQVAFALKPTAEGFLDAIAADLAVCTGLRVVITTDRDEVSERTWLHPRSFSPLDVIDRVRWQLQGAAQDASLSSPVARIRLEPVAVDAAAHHETGLWGAGPDERIHHTLSRVQSMLGHAAVVTAAIGGGRLAADRRVLVPWGERAAPPRPADRPWPGALPGFAPAEVFGTRLPAQVVDVFGEPITADARGALGGEPAAFAIGTRAEVRVVAWAGPWPVSERWWDPALARSLHRVQVVGADGSAWLLHLERGSWWAEARYD